MNTFSLQMVDKDGTVITVTTNSYADLQEVIKKLETVGWKLFNAVNAPNWTSSSSDNKPVVPNCPANIEPCPHHPEGPMKPDTRKKGEWYCHNKIDGKTWCGYKASKDGVIKESVLGTVKGQMGQDYAQTEIDF